MQRWIQLFILVLLITPNNSVCDERELWKIGILVCLSGECAVTGSNTLRGLKLAQADLNSRGGVLGHEIALIVEDTAEALSGARALTAYRKLRLEEVQYFIGPGLTPAGLTLGPLVAREKQVVMTSPSLGVSEFHRAGENLFNTRGSDEQSSRTLARYAIAKGWTRGAVFSSQQAWELLQGQFFRDEFELLGGRIVATSDPLPTIQNLATQALKITSSDAQFVFMSNTFQLSNAAKSLEALGFAKPKLLPYLDHAMVKQAQGALEGAVCTTLVSVSDNFSSRFLSQFGAVADPMAAIAYDTLMLYARAVNSVGTFDPDLVRKELTVLQSDGVSGRFRFDAEGGAIRLPALTRVQNGKFIDSVREEQF